MKDRDEDERLQRLWEEFKGNYATFGYRKASYDYFREWLKSNAEPMEDDSAEEMRARLRAYRKRQRAKKGTTTELWWSS